MLTSVLASCGTGEQESPASVPPLADTPLQAEASAASKPSLDITALQACNIVKPAEVAAIVGGTLATESTWSGPNCMYVIELGTGVESYRVSYQEPGMMAAMLDVMTPEEKGESISGEWDEAWFGKQAIGGGLHLLALRRGELAMEISGERREPVLELARLAAARVH